MPFVKTGIIANVFICCDIVAIEKAVESMRVYISGFPLTSGCRDQNSDRSKEFVADVEFKQRLRYVALLSTESEVGFSVYTESILEMIVPVSSPLAFDITTIQNN
jgi:hypothetical protein